MIPEQNYVGSEKQEFVRRYCHDLKDQIYFSSVTFSEYLFCSKFFENIFPLCKDIISCEKPSTFIRKKMCFFNEKSQRKFNKY